MKRLLLTTVAVLGLGRGDRPGPGGQGGRRPSRPTRRLSGVSGNINSVGSDTMNNLMTLWAETFQKLYPNVKIQIEGKGSSTAPPALIAGTSQFGPMSRAMKSTEIDQFEKKYGYKPTQIRTSLRRARGLRQQGQPAREADPGAGRRDLLEDPQARRTRPTSRPGASSA